MWQGRYIAAKTQGRWEYVTRTRGIGAAVILAVEDGHVLLVEQYRVPLGRACLELPAGLIGDEDAAERDPLVVARRELEEETGWTAAHLELVGVFASSPGMVGETFTLVKATGLSKISDGGGVSGEEITVHRVPLDGIAAFVAARRDEGMAMDVKLLALLGPGLLG
ncbi:NUDIX hydrolase [Sphingomonas sp. XMGL2]|uniref:GDP-mannose pyrophosphatase n=2 Tax=Sphingomonas quercus TaxID=2842451 RepID=A0ABS6BNB2_9SPHN|nr:NUDIX hydrolase [Sphingomonas quercus]